MLMTLSSNAFQCVCHLYDPTSLTLTYYMDTPTAFYANILNFVHDKNFTF
jgi:hypothetical protein